MMPIEVTGQMKVEKELSVLKQLIKNYYRLNHKH